LQEQIMCIFSIKVHFASKNLEETGSVCYCSAQHSL